MNKRQNFLFTLKQRDMRKIEDITFIVALIVFVAYVCVMFFCLGSTDINGNVTWLNGLGVVMLLVLTALVMWVKKED